MLKRLSSQSNLHQRRFTLTFSFDMMIDSQQKHSVEICIQPLYVAPKISAEAFTLLSHARLFLDFLKTKTAIFRSKND